MSRYTYAGRFQNPTTAWLVKPIEGKFGIFVRTDDREPDGSIPPDRRHTSAPLFDEAEEAEEYIEAKAEMFEEDYDDYLEENRFEIAQMERYEAFRNER